MQFVASLKQEKRLVVDCVNKQRASCQVEFLQIEEKLSYLFSKEEREEMKYLEDQKA